MPDALAQHNPTIQCHLRSLIPATAPQKKCQVHINVKPCLGKHNFMILDLLHVWSSDLDFRSKLTKMNRWFLMDWWNGNSDVDISKLFQASSFEVTCLRATFQKYLSSLTLWVRWKELPDESRNIPPLGSGSRSACAGCCWRSDKRPFYPVNTRRQCYYTHYYNHK